MSITTMPIRSRSHGRLYDALWKRQLTRYPNKPARMGYLGIVVLTTIVLYYLYYVEGAITPLLLPYYHMSFLYFLYLLVVSNAIGAFTAIIGGLSDRIGRANLTIYGTLTVGLVQLVAVPHIHSEFGFALAYCVIGFVEGIILVSTPALMRDFSPQMGRGAAMGFWALGPTVGSLLASVVATRTLVHLHPWQDQFVISGLVCMVVVAIAFVALRELSPQLRDQLMVSDNERALVDARAKGIDVDKATRHPMRSMLRLDLIASSLGISVFLLIYFASVSVLTLYWVVIFNRTTADANGINMWYWACMSLMLVFFGVVSDRFRVRKPFMLVGAAGTVVMTIVLLHQIDHPTTGYYSNVFVVVLLGLFIGMTYTPWMAGYTEAVEAHNPALSATGLAVWGWILRIVVALSFIVLPRVITTSTTLVDNQNAATNLQTFELAQPYVPAAGNLHPEGRAGECPHLAQGHAALRSGPSLGGVAPDLREDPRRHGGDGGGAGLAQDPGSGPARLLAPCHRHPGREAGLQRADRGCAVQLAPAGHIAERREEGHPGPEGVEQRVEAVVVGVRRGAARVPRARVLHARPLEPPGRQG